jgi:hypothetical protein
MPVLTRSLGWPWHLVMSSVVAELVIFARLWSLKRRSTTRCSLFVTGIYIPGRGLAGLRLWVGSVAVGPDGKRCKSGADRLRSDAVVPRAGDPAGLY